MKKVVVLIFLSVFVFACQSDRKPHGPFKDASSSEIALYDSIIYIHDEAMPLMPVIARNQKALQSLLADSTRHDSIRDQSKTLLVDLNSAEDDMMDWMKNFGGWDAIPLEERERALNAQLKSVHVMADHIYSSIDNSKQFLTNFSNENNE